MTDRIASGAPPSSVKVSLRLHTWTAKTVHLKLVEGRDLPRGDVSRSGHYEYDHSSMSSSWLNSYATMELIDITTHAPILRPKHFHHRTRTVANSSNPTWGGVVDFEGLGDDVTRVALRVVVHDATSPLGESALGGFVVPLHQGLGSHSHAQWYEYVVQVRD